MQFDRIFWDPLGYFGILWVFYADSDEWNVNGSSDWIEPRLRGWLGDLMQFAGILWDALGYFGILLECLGFFNADSDDWNVNGSPDWIRLRLLGWLGDPMQFDGIVWDSKGCLAVLRGFPAILRMVLLGLRRFCCSPKGHLTDGAFRLDFTPLRNSEASRRLTSLRRSVLARAHRRFYWP